MADFICEEELLKLEALYGDIDDEVFDPDMEVWLSPDFELGENCEHAVTTSAIINDEFVSETRNVRRKDLKNVERKHIVDKMLMLFDGKQLPKGGQQKLAEEFKVNRTTIYRIWTKALAQMKNNQVINVDNMKKGRAGRKPKEWDLERLCAVPVEKRTTLRALSSALNIGMSATYRLIKAGHLRAHSNSLKPSVSPKNKIARLIFVISQIIPPSVSTLPRFSLMYNVVHIDEKWFYMSQETQRFYLFPWEADPYRSVQNKRFIPKVMFMAAVARPIIATNGDVLWDGKIGIFPFTEVEYAKKSSKNRDKGTPETKAIQSITKQVIRSTLIDKVLPAIRQKWPENACKDIWIQQDNARPHIAVDDAEFIAASNMDGFNMRLVCQPAQSPDLNVLDLGFFRAIQSLQYKSFPRNVDELVKSVEDAYEAFDPRLLNYTWVHYQYCMIEVIKASGGNNYKNPHNGKMQMDRNGKLPKQIEVPMNDFINCRVLVEDGQITPNGILT